LHSVLSGTDLSDLFEALLSSSSAALHGLAPKRLITVTLMVSTHVLNSDGLVNRVR
jgi:hypothetical protein